VAVAAAAPYSAPAWALAWWRHAAPDDALLRVVAVWEGDELVGLGPFFAAARREWGLLASTASAGVEPLALPGREDDVAPVLAEELARAGARSLRFRGLGHDSGWLRRLAGRWPDEAPWLQVELAVPAPSVALEGSFAEWLPSLNPKFRKNMRRLARRLEEQGAVYRLADAESAEEDLRSFFRLHEARWAGRGGSGVLNAGVERMLQEAARELVPAQRLRIWSLDVEGRTIASELFVAAGGRVSSWLGGFDDAWAAQEPSKHLILRELEHAFERGDRRADLGPGEQEFKYRFADGEELVEWAVLVPRGPGYAATRLRLVPGQARRSAAAWLGPERAQALKRLLRRG
jgi:CelD/BcsL family acetyltransferase involved in cellulose biosynthesis